MKNGTFGLSSLLKAGALFLVCSMLSACCNKNLVVQDGHEAVMYYVCSECSLPCDMIIVETISQDENNGAIRPCD